MTGEPKKRSEHEREPDEYEPGSVNNSRYRAQRGPRESIRHEGGLLDQGDHCALPALPCSLKLGKAQTISMIFPRQHI